MPELPTIPGYKVECELGRGGMGVVYKCWHLTSPDPVAVKLMIAGYRASFEQLARFRIEAEALCCLNHENILKIHDVGLVDGCPYLVTEFASHGSLNDYLESHPQPLEWTVQVIHKVALALHHAHKRQILHRDVKPANILVMQDGSPKVSDFGLVKFTADIESVVLGASQMTRPTAFTAIDELLRFSKELQYDYRDVDVDGETVIQVLLKRP
jgi:serine/threonine-protein kinase